ncbi:hypothetical protein N7508_004692 [Penicillium antarcticum]|nr:uncharacterized protein N7508_004692 [Penicillium antarcticum]KAJ5305677.1 hypothetical protein N7508_004692 [Penicillium antarcticum]
MCFLCTRICNNPLAPTPPPPESQVACDTYCAMFKEIIQCGADHIRYEKANQHKKFTEVLAQLPPMLQYIEKLGLEMSSRDPHCRRVTEKSQSFFRAEFRKKLNDVSSVLAQANERIDSCPNEMTADLLDDIERSLFF